MSAGPLPSYIEPFKWADRGAEVDASAPLRTFTRLLENLSNDQGDITVRCQFVRDAQRRAYVGGKAQGMVTMTCQRCLGPVQVALDVDFRIALLREEAEAETLADDQDYLVAGEETVSLHDIVEDELILAAPLVPTHEDCEAFAYAQEELETAPKRENPFQVLAGLKGQNSEES